MAALQQMLLSLLQGTSIDCTRVILPIYLSWDYVSRHNVPPVYGPGSL